MKKIFKKRNIDIFDKQMLWSGEYTRAHDICQHIILVIPVLGECVQTNRYQIHFPHRYALSHRLISSQYQDIYKLEKKQKKKKRRNKNNLIMKERQ